MSSSMGWSRTQITLSQWYICAPIRRRPTTRISTCHLPINVSLALRVTTSSLKTSISSSSNGSAICVSLRQKPSENHIMGHKKRHGFAMALEVHLAEHAYGRIRLGKMGADADVEGAHGCYRCIY